MITYSILAQSPILIIKAPVLSISLQPQDTWSVAAPKIAGEHTCGVLLLAPEEVPELGV